MTRGSSTSGSGANRGISGAVTGVIVRYVRNRAGRGGVRDLLARAGAKRTSAELEDASSWSSLDQVVSLFDAAARVMRDPNIGWHIGEEMLGQHYVDEVGDLVRQTRSTSALLRSASVALERTSSLATVEPVEEGKGCATVKVRTHKGTTRPIYLCDLTKGFLSRVPTYFGEAPASIDEYECQARGGRFCLYEVTWGAQEGVGDQGVEVVEVAEPEADGLADEQIPPVEVLTHVPAAPEADSTRARIEELEELVSVLSSRLEEVYATSAELVSIEDAHNVLATITSRAWHDLGSPRLVLAALSPQGQTEIHSRGLGDEETAEVAERLLGQDPPSFAQDVLTLDIASPRNHYGRFAAFAPPDGFREEDTRILSAYASYAAAALDVASSIEQARRSKESASALLDFSRALAGASTVDQVAERLAETVPLVAGCDRSTVMLWDPVEQALTVRAATGPGAEAAMASDDPMSRAGYILHRDSTNLFETALNSRELIIVDRDTDDEVVRSVLEQTGTACAVISPLSASDEFFGIVTANFDNPPAVDPRMDPELQTRMSGLADHAVTAMQNARLLEQVTHLAWHDALTGLPNRRLLEDRVNQELVRARRNGESICMFFIDLDRLKQVNDTFGHAAGDDLIRHVAERLVETVRQQDTVARLGGDEFAVLLPGLSDLGDIDTLTRRTLDALRRRYTVGGKEVHVSGSIGVAVAPGHGDSYDELLSNADAAMYRAKSLGRDTYQLYSAPNGAERPDVQLELDLKHAVERSELTLLYQPVFDMETTEVIAVEALTRWRHPVRGILDPDTFLALATDAEVIAGIDTWVVSEACHQIAVWTANGLEPLRVSLNITSRSLAFPGFADSVEGAINAAKIDPALIELEVSDLGNLDPDGPARRSVDLLVSMGVHFAVDDVGTASVASSRLGSIQVSTLKLDRSFVQMLGEDDDTAALVSAIVALTSRHGIRCVAEGVETQQQARSLLTQGCRYAQGFLFSPPLLPGDVEQMLGGSRGSAGPRNAPDRGVPTAS